MAKQPRLIAPKAHRPVNYDEKAIQTLLDKGIPVLVQDKEDGIRIHVWREENNWIRITTREGIEIRSLEEEKEQLRQVLQNLPPYYVIDGEATVPGVTFEEASGTLRRHALVEPGTVQFYVWDLFPLASLLGDEAYDIQYFTRLDALCAALEKWGGNVKSVATLLCKDMQEVQQAFSNARRRKKEGVVVKVATLPVRNSKVTGQWKMKPEETFDGVIVGYVWGTPGLGNEGLIIGFRVRLESGVEVDVTGITQDKMQEFTAEYSRLAAKASMAGPFAYMGRYCEVKAMEVTAGGSLRHPSFVRFRDMDYTPGVKA